MTFQANCGVEDFKTLIETECTYVDKSMYLKDLFWGTDYGTHRSSNTPVFLFLRPRRFGKTLTLSMIKYFFKLDYENAANQDKARALFENLEIYKDKEFCHKHMAQYPVISISLKDVGCAEYKKSLKILGTKIAEEFYPIVEHKDYPLLQQNLKDTVDFFTHIATLKLSDEDSISDLEYYIQVSLKNLSKILYSLYKRKVIVLIDEYDVPLQKAAVHGYYDEMVEVIRSMFSDVLKTNGQYLERAVLSGCMRVSKESIFTGLNNLSVFSINDEPFNTFIGFTKEEVKKLIQGTPFKTRESEIFDWYDGYNFCGAEMICPFSVLNFMNRALASSDVDNYKCENFWANTSGNEIIDRLFTLNNEVASEKLQQLVKGQSITINSYETVTYNDIFKINSFDYLMILLMHTGYVTVLAKEDDLYTIAIPNKEVLSCFKERINNYFNPSNLKWYNEGLDLKNALFEGDTAKAQNIICNMLINFISVRDTASEGNYHVFLLTVLSMFSGTNFKVESNKESGKGYYDLSLCDRLLNTCVIIETKKASSDAKYSEIRDKGQKALVQIEDKDYISDARANGFNIIKYGIVFYGKSCYMIKG